MQVNCAALAFNYNATPPIEFGSGAEIDRVIIRKADFLIEMRTILPTVGFNPDDPVSSDNATWLQQSCIVQGHAGKGTWYFDYLVDEWEMVTAGKAAALDLPGFRHTVVKDTKEIRTADIIRRMRSRSDVDSHQSELLVQALVRGVNNSMNGVWYLPSQGGTFSNVMSWATKPDGYYYAELTERGLSGALGTIAHQIYLQFDAAEQAHCEYWGADGSGKMFLHVELIYIANSILGFCLLWLLFQVIVSRLSHPVKSKEMFAVGIRLLIQETWLHFCTANFMMDLMKKNQNEIAENPDSIVEKFTNTRVRYGHKKGKTRLGELRPKHLIGPVHEMVKARLVGKSLSLWKSASVESTARNSGSNAGPLKSL